METLEKKIATVVNKKLNDGTVEELIEKCLEKGILDAISSIFSYGGDGKKLLESKVKEVIIPVIEHHKFNQYLVKLDTVLTEIINQTSLVENKEILEKFKTLMIEQDEKEVNLSSIFRKYCEHVAKNVDTSELEADCEDGEPFYEFVTASMEVEYEDKSWFSSSFEDCKVKFTCEKDKDLNCQIELNKLNTEKNWYIRGLDTSVDISSLRGMSDFGVYLLTLKRGFTDIIIDKDDDFNDEIEPEAKPEWSLN